MPEYWSPPSLFDLARRTGFDVESLIFCFGIGGVGAALVNVLTRTAPGYVEEVWNLDALSGVRLGFMPLEELLFALGLRAYWASVYEHYTWRRPVAVDGAVDATVTKEAS